jgi:hypothetical protein
MSPAEGALKSSFPPILQKVQSLFLASSTLSISALAKKCVLMFEAEWKIYNWYGPARPVATSGQDGQAEFVTALSSDCWNNLFTISWLTTPLQRFNVLP